VGREIALSSVVVGLRMTMSVTERVKPRHF
jgi:hypothetical protein